MTTELALQITGMTKNFGGLKAIDGVNLTNQGARRYADTTAFPIEYEKFGPRYIGGVRFNF